MRANRNQRNLFEEARQLNLWNDQAPPAAPSLLDEMPVIYSYTRQQAIDDGVLVSGNEGDFDEVTRQHYKSPVAMTAAVFAMIERAVAHPKHCNDFKGVWHDILWMSRQQSAIVQRFDSTSHLFRVVITGTGKRRTDGLEWHTLKIVCGPGDDAEPVVTIMLPEED